MITIHLKTIIEAPRERCFDLSRSIDLHRATMARSDEKAMAGRTSGLIEYGETVTWQATHFYVQQHLTSRVTEMNRPHFFIDEMIEGAFKSMWHCHSFESLGDVTVMKDEFRYEVPFGIAGWCFDRVILRRYMNNLLKERNQLIKEVAEDERWQHYLKHTSA